MNDFAHENVRRFSNRQLLPWKGLFSVVELITRFPDDEILQCFADLTMYYRTYVQEPPSRLFSDERTEIVSTPDKKNNDELSAHQFEPTFDSWELP